MVFFKCEDLYSGVLLTFAHYTPVIHTLKVFDPVLLLGAESAAFDALHLNPQAPRWNAQIGHTATYPFSLELGGYREAPKPSVGYCKDANAFESLAKPAHQLALLKMLAWNGVFQKLTSCCHLSQPSTVEANSSGGCIQNSMHRPSVP